MVVDTQANNPAIDQKELTDLEKLKASNDEFEKELIKAREMRAERQKIEAEQMLGSTAGQPKPIEPPKEESDKEYSERIKREIREGKFNG
jgi:hypothetical protein